MTAVSEASGVVDPREVTLAALFLGFLRIALSGFGGVLAWARWLIVEQRRWMSEADFLDMLSLCQFLPGPNIVNVSFYIGGRFRGPLGALAAFSGLMIAPTMIAVALGMLYAKFGDLAAVRGGFLGISAAAAGLVIAMALKLARPLRTKPVGIFFGLAAFGVVGVLRVPMAEALLALAPVSVAVAWVRRR